MKILMKIKAQKKYFSKAIYTSCYLFLLTLFLYFMLQQGYSVIACNTPKELREMNTVAFAHRFAYLDNPYSASVLMHEIPVVTSIYGLLVPLVMSPFIRLLSFTHLSALQICELLTLIIELIGTVYFYQLALRKTGNHLFSLAGAFLFHTCYWRYAAFGGAFPDQWGLALSIVLMNRLHADEQNQHYHPLLYAGYLISLFYIKQYFALLAIGLCAYLLFHSVKDLKKLILYGILLSGISVVLVYLLFPLYFTEVFPVAHGQTITGDPSYSIKQIIRLSMYYAPVVLFTVTRLVVNIHNLIKHRQFRFHKVTYEFCQISLILLPLFLIAENQGTNYTYYLQLWFPYIILYGVVFASDALTYLRQKIALPVCISNPGTLLPVVSSVLICLVTLLSLARVLPSYHSEPMTHEQQQAWDNAYDILDRCSCEGEILVSMLLSDYCLERGIATSNYGQAEYNHSGNLENYRNNKLWRNIFLFDDTEKLLQKNILYNQTVRDKVYAQSYRCIALAYAGEYHLSEEDYANAGYRAIASEELTAGTQCWHIVFYVPAD